MVVVEPSSAPRPFVASTAPLSRSHVGRTRKGTGTRGQSRVPESSVEPPPARAIGAEEATTLQPPRARPDPSSSGLRSPLARYLLLSAILVSLGLSLRYLWRQLAGLVGAALILSTARLWQSSAGGAATARGKSSGAATAAPSGSGRGAPRKDASCGADGSEPAAEATGPRDGLGGSSSRREGGGGFADAPAAFSRFWEDGGPGCKLLVRGPKYVVDRKKIPAGPAAMRLVHVDLFAVEREVFHVASKGRCRDRVSGFFRGYEERGEAPPFLFILNILVPGNPVVATVMYWALDGAGDGEEPPSSSASAAPGSGHSTFLKMLERYAEVPGSGYKKLDRVRSSSSSSSSSSSGSPSPPPLSSTSAAEVNISSSSSSSSSPASPASPPPSLPEGARRPHASSPPPPPSAPLPRAAEGGSGHQSMRHGGIDGSSSGGGVGNGADAGESSFLEPGRLEPGAGTGAGTVTPSQQEQQQQEQQEQQRGRSPPVSPLADRNSDPAGLLPEDDFRNQRFKLIPSIVSGPFIVRKAVGNKPALLGRKVTQRYFRGPGYVETDVDVGSSIIAEKIVSLCRGYARSLTVELGICLEGRCEAELPEKVIGAIRLISLDLDQAEPLMEPSQAATM